MSRRNSRSNNTNLGAELKLNLSAPLRIRGAIHGGRAAAAAAVESPETSPARSCVSSEGSPKYSSSPEAETTSMVVVGCPRCLMYVMLSEVDPMCPRCKSTVLLDLSAAAANRRRRNYDNDDGDGETSVN